MQPVKLQLDQRATKFIYDKDFAPSSAHVFCMVDVSSRDKTVTVTGHYADGIVYIDSVEERDF